MPIRTYLCYACGRMFEKMDRGDGTSPPCKKCNSPDTRLKPRSRAGVSVEHTPTTPTPQTTGATLMDHDVDMVIARNAQQSLREMELRQEYKRKLILAERTDGFHLSRLDNGEYFVLSEEERLAAKKARILHQDAIREINTIKKKS